MAERQRNFIGRWPAAVFLAAVMVAVSLGDVVAGWYAFAGRGSSAPGEYPVRIVLRQAGSAEQANHATAPLPESIADGGELASGAVPMAGGPAVVSGETPADMRLAEAASARPPATDGLLAVRFDLADPDAYGGGGSAIEIRKAVRLNGSDAGEARIHVAASSRLSIAREELRRLLARSGQQELAEQMAGDSRFVSFDEVRRQGIEVRYDPVSDRILVST